MARTTKEKKEKTAKETDLNETAEKTVEASEKSETKKSVNKKEDKKEDKNESIKEVIGSDGKPIKAAKKIKKSSLGIKKK